MNHLTAVVLLVSDWEEDGSMALAGARRAVGASLRQADVGQLIAEDRLFSGWKRPDISHPNLAGGDNSGASAWADTEPDLFSRPG